MTKWQNIHQPPFPFPPLKHPLKQDSCAFIVSREDKQLDLVFLAFVTFTCWYCCCLLLHIVIVVVVRDFVFINFVPVISYVSVNEVDTSVMRINWSHYLISVCESERRKKKGKSKLRAIPTVNAIAKRKSSVFAIYFEVSCHLSCMYLIFISYLKTLFQIPQY